MALARSFAKAALAAALGAFALAAAPAHAQPQRPIPGWSVCNQTSYVLEAAAGRPEGRSIMVQGWSRLRPGECKAVAPAPITRGVHYLYARTSNAHRGGRRQWGGAATLCVDPMNSFSIENPPRCETMGLEQRTFREVRINKRDSWRTILAEAEPYTLQRARSAGVQRLLEDAGYDDGGGDPRRLAASITRLRSEARLPANAGEDQIIDALEGIARRRSEQVGLTLCNRTNQKVWTAVARRRGEGWESRGWWPLAPAGCARTIDDPLFQNLYYVHAQMETKEGSRFLSAAGEEFCTARTRFAILGRQNCSKRYYNADIFAPITSAGREGMVVEFQDKDFLGPGLKPRRIDSPQLARDDAAAAAAATAGGAVRGAVPAGAGDRVDPATQVRPGQQRPTGQQRTVRDLIGAGAAPAPAQPGARPQGTLPGAPPPPPQPRTTEGPPPQ